jgi:hypothetical protein
VLREVGVIGAMLVEGALATKAVRASGKVGDTMNKGEECSRTGTGGTDGEHSVGPRNRARAGHTGDDCK